MKKYSEYRHIYVLDMADISVFYTFDGRFFRLMPEIKVSLDFPKTSEMSKMS